MWYDREKWEHSKQDKLYDSIKAKKRKKMAVIGNTANIPDWFICGWKYKTQEIMPWATRKGC